jgi:hypothetical protein
MMRELLLWFVDAFLLTIEWLLMLSLLLLVLAIPMTVIGVLAWQIIT